MTQAEKMGSMRKSPLNRYVSVKSQVSSSRKIQPQEAPVSQNFLISRHCQHRLSYTIPNPL